VLGDDPVVGAGVSDALDDNPRDRDENQKHESRL
jgi:hypothetical protein